jgi:hypothetical protein
MIPARQLTASCLSVLVPAVLLGETVTGVAVRAPRM